MYIKDKMRRKTMTCRPPIGGVERPSNAFECTRDTDCTADRAKTALHNKCVKNMCAMQYRRVIDVGLMTAEEDSNNHCNMMGHGWETVPVDTEGWQDADDKDQARLA